MTENKFELNEIGSFFVSGSEIRAIGADGGRIAYLLSDGAVMSLDVLTGETVRIFDTAEDVNYDDGGFDCNAPSAVYLMDGYTAVVNCRGRHGFVNSDEGDYTLRLMRDGYQTAHTEYPMAFFRRDGGVCMIFGEAWNHLQIADLTTRRVLTAAKSRVTEGAEENHIAYYREHEEQNKLLWPAEYDYFYGKIKVSPDGAHFLSCGWVWGAFDAVAAYDAEDFVLNPRIRESVVFAGEHLSRSACFCGNDAAALPVKPDIDDYGYDGGDGIPWEVRLYSLDGVELGAVQMPGMNLAKASLAYAGGCVCVWGEEFGFAAVDFESGEIVYRDEDFCPAAFDESNGWFVTEEDGVIGVWEMK
ncbi:MAG: hypothetical protein IJY35_11795 [Clostridia bacterium]|nr:hypothetical protein [Clostridia bacterium]